MRSTSRLAPSTRASASGHLGNLSLYQYSNKHVSYHINAQTYMVQELQRYLVVSA